jgi:hypothetical protein
VAAAGWPQGAANIWNIGKAWSAGNIPEYWQAE